MLSMSCDVHAVACREHMKCDQTPLWLVLLAERLSVRFVLAFGTCCVNRDATNCYPVVHDEISPLMLGMSCDVHAVAYCEHAKYEQTTLCLGMLLAVLLSVLFVLAHGVCCMNCDATNYSPLVEDVLSPMMPILCCGVHTVSFGACLKSHM